MAALTKFRQFVKSVNDAVEYDLRPYQPILQDIHAFHNTIKGYSNEELQMLSKEFKLKQAQGAELDQLLVPIYALVKEACIRKLGLKPFDVQIIGGIAMHYGKLIEMQTGEGKTLTALFPACLNAYSGKGVHILTFNDYLAKRDAQWMGAVYEFLGLSVGYIEEGMSRKEKYQAYYSDITYATAKSVGFDYLRSFIAYEETELFLRPFHFALIDEADAILIDEARNPLVLAGDIIDAELDFYNIAQLIQTLEEDKHFGLNIHARNIFFTEDGIETLEKCLQVDNLQADQHYYLYSALSLALHARMLLQRDIDYVIRDGKIKLVDELTGRIVEDRKWRNGLQTAVEAKEGLEIQSEGLILNSISLRHFMSQYPKRAGMTATAEDAAAEFYDFYGMPVVIIPPNKVCNRVDHPDHVFRTVEAKQQALIKEVKKVNASGQPILIGTLTVKESEALAKLFSEEGIECKVLNAKNNELEAAIIADAGKLGAVTISTNMAGRGTDIVLGGADAAQREAVLALGGLYVIGTNRHESKRIDRQLKGRAGRQGDVGSSQFFISLEDHLMQKYQLKNALPKRFRNPEGEGPLKDRVYLKFIDHIQRVIEGESYEMRKSLFVYSDLIEKQRLIIQLERQHLLQDTEQLFEMMPIEPCKLKELRSMLKKVKTLCLYQFDKFWAEHLDFLLELKEGVHLASIGGQNPLWVFQQKADADFQSLRLRISKAIHFKVTELLQKPESSLKDLGMKKPSSTWTFVIGDNGFGDKLAMKLLGNGNIGFQIDFLSVFLLFFVAIFRQMKSWFGKFGKS